jgi:hypothetical protein
MLIRYCHYIIKIYFADYVGRVKILFTFVSTNLKQTAMKLKIDIGMFITGESKITSLFDNINFAPYIQVIPTLGTCFNLKRLIQTCPCIGPELRETFIDWLEANNEANDFPLYVREIYHTFDNKQGVFEQIITLNLGNMDDGNYDKLYMGKLN